MTRQDDDYRITAPTLPDNIPVGPSKYNHLHEPAGCVTSNPCGLTTSPPGDHRTDITMYAADLWHTALDETVMDTNMETI